ncbi:MAG: quinone oxidoreductase family protein [Ardenticatenaceae bacterium]
MKALVFTGVGQALSYQDIEVAPPAAGQVVVQMKAAALNHRDNWILKGMYPGLKENTIVGSDGVGVIDGRAVIINPNNNWGDNPKFPSREYSILGMPVNGTFAEEIVIGADRLADKPSHLTFEQAAALPLAGLTAYRALFTRCQLERGENVLISGVGGGVALMACQFAIAAGANVYVTSSSQKKIDAAIALGAKGGANYKEKGWEKPFGKATGRFDVIIDSAAGPGFNNLVKLTRPGGRIGLYGGTRGTMEKISAPLVFFRQIAILGSTMGTDQEFEQMVEFVNQHKIVPVVDSVFPLKDGNAAIERISKGLQFGKIVLKIAE